MPVAAVIAALRAPRYTLLAGSALVITVLFNEAYSNADIDRYYLGPVLWIWTLLAIAGAELGGLATRAAAAVVPALRRAEIVAAAIVAIVLLYPAANELDDRRAAADRSGDTGAQAFLDEALPALEPNAVIVSWWSTSTPLWYAQKVEGLRPDVFIVDDRTMLDLQLGRAPDVIRRYLAEGRPTYAIRIAGLDLDELKRQFAMTLVAGREFDHTGVWKVSGPGVTLQ